ncbi:hypothetical protein QOZ98_001752 [Planomicrobium stackebrandtii]|uniref:Uncharacterized protein n=1 Tax=Planomicrobium stackebrandtii TaxID=253160 RepID=A0ABU0GU95_9BACL|nr:hypothetical protein [Planomicrobium stackebrandtii]MDQ0428925.1 hypothetical protein [Planomicrobium stackebrandtii]
MMGSVGVAIIIFGLVGIGIYWSSHKTKSALKNENRELLLLTQDEFLKKQKELDLDFVEGTESSFRTCAQELEAAYPLDYQLHIYNRMVKETRYSQATILELMFEQKRFLLMASILKKVPMFSKAVDEVWHQQLMFTNEYRDFTEKFAGRFIHHAPNVDGTDGVDDKFLFDMAYKKLFIEKPSSAKSWGAPFYEMVPSASFLAEWRDSDISLLESQYFFDRSETRRSVYGLIREIKSDIESAMNKGKYSRFLEKQSRIVQGSYPTPGTSNELTLPYVIWAAGDTGATYSESLGLAKTHKKIKSDSDGGNSGFFGTVLDKPKSSKEAWCGSDSSDSGGSGDSGGGSSCGSSCGSSS